MLDFNERLAELESSGLRRRLRLIEGPQGPVVVLAGRPVMLLCSNAVSVKMMLVLTWFRKVFAWMVIPSAPWSE